eukprot:14603651-Ditylum_brightwellii.AAC.1
MNKQKVSEKAKFPHTQSCIFVPFKADGSITEQHTALMIRKQYIYLRDETAISVTGLRQINSIITVPGTATKFSFHRWLLTVKTVDESMLLFSAIEKDPNKVYNFITKKYLRDEAENWIDDLPELLFCRFLPSDMDKVTTDTHPTRSYRVLPTKNTDDAVSVHNTILSGDMLAESPDGDDPKVIDVVEEDVLENCWTAPPPSVYSQTDTDSTLLST